MSLVQTGSGKPVQIQTERGPIACLYHEGKPGAGGVVLVGGTDGGFDGPASGIYATLADDLLALMLAHPRVRAARVATEKPDVYPDCDAVGCEVFGIKDSAP